MVKLSMTCTVKGEWRCSALVRGSALWLGRQSLSEQCLEQGGYGVSCSSRERVLDRKESQENSVGYPAGLSA